MYYLYVKTHIKTGLKYLGYTKKDPFKYKGSGTRWCLHIKKHGHSVWTNVIFQSSIKEEVKQQGILFSEHWDVVNDKNWANIVPETAEGAGLVGEQNGMYGRTHTKEVKEKSC